MNSQCETCQHALVVSKPAVDAIKAVKAKEAAGDRPAIKAVEAVAAKEAIYILHGPRDCVKHLSLRAETAEEDLADTRKRFRTLRKTIEDEFRFRAQVGQMDEDSWAKRICLPSLQEALKA